ncbi:MAG: N-acetylmuramoyl-L-alanine amidase [Ferruginibacter sp.]
MLAFAFYLLKVIICSGILFGYYWLALRNKIFHQYNRFYLLASIVLSLLLPLITINIWHNAGADKPQAIKILQVVTSSSEYLDEIVITARHNSFTTEQAILLVYGLITFIFLATFTAGLIKIRQLFIRHQHNFFQNILFINTTAKGTPFSFLKYIFWNDNIDLDSATGKQIFKHEVAHVRQKHSYDKLFLNVVLIFSWINPFFWLIRKELNMIHEFIADKIAVEDSNTESFAAMILQAAYPQHRFQLSNPFFYSPIKRRLMMLSKNRNLKVGYIGRLLALPLAVFIFAAFTLKTKTVVNDVDLYHGKKLKVVIDAGHGGSDKGAAGNQVTIFEKDLNLQIVQKIKALNSNNNIELVFTRLTDVFQTVQEKAAFTQEAKADIFISIHVGASSPNETNPISGMQVFLASKNEPGAQRSQLLASAIINQFTSNYSLPVQQYPERRQMSIRVLDAAICPAVLIEAGNISNEKDFTFLQNESAKELIAKNILSAINKYAVAIESATNKTTGSSIGNIISSKDTLPQVELKNVENALIIVDGTPMNYDQFKKIKPDEIASIDVLKSGESLKKYGDKGKNGVVLVTTKTFTVELNDVKISMKDDKDSTLNSTASIKFKGRSSDLGELNKVLFIVDGKVQDKDFDLKTILPDDIKSINVLKDKSATEKYGEKAVNGAIEIYTKKGNKEITFQGIQGNGLTAAPGNNQGDDKIFTKVENEPQFPGGDTAWRNYLQKHINAAMPIDEGWKAGVYKITVEFIVDKKGNISNIKTDDFPGTKTAQQCIDLIAKGPKWIPAKQNDVVVNAYRKQPITFVIEEQ